VVAGDVPDPWVPDPWADKDSTAPNSFYRYPYHEYGTCPNCGYCPYCGRGGGYKIHPWVINPWGTQIIHTTTGDPFPNTSQTITISNENGK
jgi:hypothetical protein